ncbi:MAG: flagellar hook-length control protein FliK [Planctomycetota bacterium]|jgi:flagellar hook-length control protein FliK
MAVLDVMAPSAMGASAPGQTMPLAGNFAETLEGALAALVDGYEDGAALPPGQLLQLFIKQLGESPAAGAVALENLAAAELPPGLTRAAGRATENGAGAPEGETEQPEGGGLRALIEQLAAIVTEAGAIAVPPPPEPSAAPNNGLPALLEEVVNRAAALLESPSVNTAPQPGAPSEGGSQTAGPAPGTFAEAFAPVTERTPEVPAQPEQRQSPDIAGEQMTVAAEAVTAAAEETTAAVEEMVNVVEQNVPSGEQVIVEPDAVAEVSAPTEIPQSQVEAKADEGEVGVTLQEAGMDLEGGEETYVRPVESGGENTVPQAAGTTAETVGPLQGAETVVEAVRQEAARRSEPEQVETSGRSAASIEGQEALSGAGTTERSPSVEMTARADQERMIARIAGAVSQASAGGRTTVRLRLYPPHLGTVRIEVSSMRGVVSARLETSTAGARQVLSANLSALRESIRGAGVNLRDMEVDYRNPSAQFGLYEQRGGRDPRERPHGWTDRREKDRTQAAEASETMGEETATAAGVLDLLV